MDYRCNSKIGSMSSPSSCILVCDAILKRVNVPWGKWFILGLEHDIYYAIKDMFETKKKKRTTMD